ncbi:MAG: ribose ABC transporter [Hyphomicrobiales bacterium]|nr:ribose ABC transporter [Hyphomicrobiales bacterium]
MLIGLDPLLGPELLQALRAMGHGDDIVLADANFPAAATARRLIRLDGCTLARALTAVLSVLPLDRTEPHAAAAMEVVGDPLRRDAIHHEIATLLSREGRPAPELHYLERHAFYARARDAFAVVQTGERRFYGDVILRKGTVDAHGQA